MVFNIETSVWINSIGLLIDIAGALLIYKNTPKVNFDSFYYDEEVHAKMRVTAKKMNDRVRLGTLLLFSGFIIQLLSNWL
ncbi:MAG: hypothetical protein COB12_04780 [Flavobacterium sp.]|nr:MAG: hypothetical protein COB12_04780 [Flavobacterium sp.]